MTNLIFFHSEVNDCVVKWQTVAVACPSTLVPNIPETKLVRYRLNKWLRRWVDN